MKTIPELRCEKRNILKELYRLYEDVSREAS